jgi:hypothetical protein
LKGKMVMDAECTTFVRSSIVAITLPHKSYRYH